MYKSHHNEIFTEDQLNLFVEGYISELLFACEDIDGAPLELNYSMEDLDDELFEKIQNDCLMFMKMAPSPITEWDIDDYGMHFFSTRHAEGTRFSDLDMDPKDARELCLLSKMFSEKHYYVKDGKIIGE